MTKIHNPKVAGSGPAPATRKRHSLSAFFSLILLRLSCNPTAERTWLFHNHLTPLWKWKFAEIEPVPAPNDGCTCGRNICESHPCSIPEPWRSKQYKDQSHSGFLCIPGRLFPSNRIQILNSPFRSAAAFYLQPKQCLCILERPPGECIRTYIKPWDGDFVPARIDPGVWQSHTYPLRPLTRSSSMKAVQQPISFSAVIKTFAHGYTPDAQGCQYGIPSYGYLASGAH
jgi:hypothetical protein